MIRIITAFVCLSAAALLAQTPNPALTFDVTSVTPNTSSETGGTNKAEPGRYVGINVTLRRALGLAYSPVQEFVGGPGWLNTDRFDIEGKSESKPNQEQMREMLRSLLADRFKLVVHRETRHMPAYALTLARADGRLGSDLRRTAPCDAPVAPSPSPAPVQQRRCGGFRVGNGSISGAGVTMRQLAGELGSATEGRHVVDRTGLDGTFDLNLTWNAEALRPDAAAAEQAASIFAAIQEQLGLKLEPITAPIEVIVIDRAERPAGN